MRLATRIFKTAEFMKFATKAKIPDGILVESIERVERGLVDADLGGGILKLRVARPNEGRRGGYRTIVACIVGRRAFFVFGFGKNNAANIESSELQRFRRLGEVLQSLDDSMLDRAVNAKELSEIER